MKDSHFFWWEKDGKFFWHLKGANGEIVCSGESNGYASKQKMLQGISIVRNSESAGLIQYAAEPSVK